MIYSPSTTAALGIVEDAQPEEPLTLRGEGLWACPIFICCQDMASSICANAFLK